MNKAIPKRYKPSEFESKWQAKWKSEKIYSPDMEKAKKPFYNLMMFPYPSAEGLHVGNMYAFTGVDVFGRFKRMQGFDVFEPIGLDGFGIHSENYALKVNRHPQEQAKISEKNYYRQLEATGNGFDWSRTLETYDPDYYRWTQWLFIQMFKNGLAYRANAQVNWCPSCKTVLADEQVVEGKCERCSSLVVMRELEQWFFKITKYADKLLQNTYKPSFNWTEKIKIGQRNWIGKKEGINITYHLKNSSKTISVWTSRPDTNFGASFVVLSPEHPQVIEITTQENLEIVKKYITKSQNISKDKRIAVGRKKTGVFTGSYAINQLTNQEMPIYVADFVLMDVGTGAVVGVPGHDKRDFEFAQTFSLPIKRVVVGKDGDQSQINKIEQVQEEVGVMVNSGFLDGLDIHNATKKVIDFMEANGYGQRVTTYHLRDWLISRQRYWGAPIPMIYCEKCANQGKSWFEKQELKTQNSMPKKLNTGNWDLSSLANMCGWFPVPENQLPVLLPDVKDWRPTGTDRGPLAGHPEFYETSCPNCGGSAKRETDVCDTFLDSSWYFLRYPSLGSKKAVVPNTAENNEKTEVSVPWDQEITQRWLPVDSYIGGAEHTVLHLLYARFIWMALRDGNLIKINSAQAEGFDPDEPFKRFFAHGLIIKDGAKMSKSKGNVVVPDQYIELYGTDTLRSYLMFLGPFDAGGDFRDSGIAGMYRWLSRVWRLVNEFANSANKNSTSDHPEAIKMMAKTVKKVTQDLEHLHFNTALAKLMEFTNWWMDHKSKINLDLITDFLKLLAPFAPYMTEELFQKLKNGQSFISLHLQSWPVTDEKLLTEDRVTIVVQINGKVRDSLIMKTQDANNEATVKQSALASDRVSKWLTDKQIIKTIFISGKLINFVSA